ncbi:hypothetical protein [Methylobacterium sp. J-068]|uniref:hypothetical protein n=1 Tax=Methylobacterium sp. J-068 TaxID=2836649 RepID=UPI001FBA214B|nr:hypothetical protein [Methylobacterium sp. J-068]MCJ2036967.1 hypothetical protein [Methylobacterium sp. J-068]
MLLSPLRLVLAAAPLLAGLPAMAQTAVKLDGRCEKLVIAGKDVTATCKGTLMNTVSRSRTSFDFAAEGRSLSFSGNGAQQERTEETDPLQPINLVIPSETTKDGVVQGPLVAVGSCTFSTPQPGKTAITCEANAAKGAYQGTFVTDAKAPDAAKENGSAPAR